MLSKLQSILTGWRGYLWETPEIKFIAECRAVSCAKCEHAVSGLIVQFMEDDVKEIEGMKCNLCDCPLSTLLRSPKEKCKANKW